MGSKSPSWADQWGTGPFSSEEDHEKPMKNKSRLGKSSSRSNKKLERVKSVASTGLDKAKSAAIVGAHKVKTGTFTGFKWLKNKYSSSSSSK